MRVPGFRSRLIDSIQCSFQNVLRSSLRLLLRLEPNEPHRYLRYRPSENPPPWYCEDEVISVRLTEEVRKFYLDYTGLEGSALEKRLREIVSILFRTVLFYTLEAFLPQFRKSF